MIKIDSQWLIAHEACAPQVKKFAEVFPEGCNLTRQNIQIALGHNLDIYWFSWRVLDRAQRNLLRMRVRAVDDIYTASIRRNREECDAKVAACHTAYHAAVKQAQAIFDEALTTITKSDGDKGKTRIDKGTTQYAESKAEYEIALSSAYTNTEKISEEIGKERTERQRALYSEYRQALAALLIEFLTPEDAPNE